VLRGQGRDGPLLVVVVVVEAVAGPGVFRLSSSRIAFRRSSVRYELTGELEA